MSDLAKLKQRVESAIDKMANGQEVERQEHDALVNLIAELEVKYEARHKELTYCHTRIADLEKTNQQLSELLNTVVHLIETRSADDPSDPIHQASKMASDLASLFADSLSADAGSDVTPDSEPEMVTIEAEFVEETGFVEDENLPAPEREPAEATAEPLSDGRRSALKELFGDYTSELEATGSHPDTVETSISMELADEADAAAEEPAGQAQEIPMPVPAGLSEMEEISGGGMAFDEVSDEELEVETLLDSSQGPSYPDSVIAATDAARSNGTGPADPLEFGAAPVEIVETAVAGGEEESLDIPGVDNVSKLHVIREAEEQSVVQVEESPKAGPKPKTGGDADIKALMTRLQQAAEKARATAEEFGTSTKSGTAPPKADTG